MATEQRDSAGRLGGSAGWRVAALLAGPGLGILAWWFLPESYAGAGGASHALTPEARATIAIAVWMAIWWLTEATHISTTALLPLVAFPLTGCLTLSQAAAPYAHPLVFLFLGGFLIALAMQRWRLDRRIALLTLACVGTRPAAMVGGFMLATAVLSAFVSNTATAAMMLPITLSVIDLVIGDRSEGRSPDRLATALLLSVAYAATLGGMTTLIGTPPNVALAAFMSESIGEAHRLELTFTGWLPIGLPMGMVLLPIVWLLLTRVLIRLDREPISGGRALIRGELSKLGRLTWAEGTTLVVFGLTCAAWIFRPLIVKWTLPKFLGGGAPLALLSDAQIAIIGGVMLMLIPSRRTPRDTIIDWRIARRVPWEILLLFGGGLSLAAAMRDNGVAEFLAVQAAALQGTPHWLLILAVSATVVFLTELTSNLATTAALLPVLAAIAPGLGLHPYVLIIPATLAASCAFMLPVATPPNAIVFGSGLLAMRDMVRIGWWLNLICIVWLTVLTEFWLPHVLPIPGPP